MCVPCTTQWNRIDFPPLILASMDNTTDTSHSFYRENKYAYWHFGSYFVATSLFFCAFAYSCSCYFLRIQSQYASLPKRMKRRRRRKKKERKEQQNLCFFFWFNFNRKSTKRKTHGRLMKWSIHEFWHCAIFFASLRLSLRVSVCFRLMCIFKAFCIQKLLEKHLSSEKSNGRTWFLQQQQKKDPIGNSQRLSHCCEFKQMHCTTKILRQSSILVKDCLCERLSSKHFSSSLPLLWLLLLLLYLNSWISFSVPFFDGYFYANN